MKPAITTITLLVANILLLGYVLVIDRKKPDTETDNIRRGNLAIFDPEAVTKIVLQTPEGKAEIVKLADESWRFTAPFNDRFDPKLMVEIFKDASHMRINDTVSAKEIKKEGWGADYFGFGDGTISLEMFDEDGSSLAGIELGAPTPVEKTVYARRMGDDSEQVHFVWSDLRDVIAQPFNKLRDRRLIYAKVDDVFRVKFRPPPAASLDVHVEKGLDRRWRMEHPLEARCDEELVEDLVANLAKLEVAEFVDQPGAGMEAAFDENRYEIVMRQHTPAADNKKITIEFGRLPTDEDDPHVLARVSDREGVLFRVDRGVHYAFGMDGNSLRDRTLADFDYNAVSGVRIKRVSGEEIALKRWGNAWALQRDPNDLQKLESANGRLVKELIERINDDEILQFASDAAADLEPYGLKEPAMEITVTRLYIDPAEEVEPGQKPMLIPIEDTLMLGVGFINQPGGEPFAAFKGEHYVYKIGDSLPSYIGRQKPLSFKTRQLWPRFTPFDLRKITIQDKTTQDPLELEYNHERNLWRATMGGVDVTDNIDRVVLDGYLEYLGGPPLGDGWTESTKHSILRLAEPDITITIDVIDPQDQKTPRRITFRATATVDRGKLYYGRIDSGADVILLNDDVIRNLRVPLKKLAK